MPTTTAAPIARGGAGRLPPTRSTTTCLRKLISFSWRHQCDALRLRVEPERELFLERERPPDPREVDDVLLDDVLLRPLGPLRPPPEELELERREGACFLRFFGCGECECSLSWMSSNSA